MPDPETVRILVTMDVEPVKQQPRWTGPADAATSARLIRAYAELAERHHYPVTFFIHPEAAELHRDLFHELEQRGHGLGLHVHPTRFRYPQYQRELGFYSGEEQRELLTLARAQWAAALGRAPTLFRPGAFSANDATFPTLVALGFRGGCVSIPGRIWPQRYCVWAGAELDPHRAHPCFRQVAGNLPFANVPLSVDVHAVVQARGLTYFRDLRPNAREVPVGETVRGILAGLAERRPPVPVVHFVTHNDQPFDDPTSEACRRLTEVLATVEPCCREFGWTAVGSTVADVCEQVLALPPAPPPQWLLADEVTM